MIDQKRISHGDCSGRLEGKVVLITGAGGGQGHVITLKFAEAGAHVFASDINPDTLALTAEAAKKQGLSITTTVVDASSQEQAQAWVDEAMAAHGRIDALYNNGAHVHMAPFSEMTAEQWHETIRLELDVIFMPTNSLIVSKNQV